MRAALEYYFRNDCTEGGGTIQSTLDQLETILTQAIVGVARALHIHDIDMTCHVLPYKLRHPPIEAQLRHNECTINAQLRHN